ncbi:MAG: PTPA-CTERM sorting domain-containing protein [Cyanobacteria bacterium P01_D01_bin.105]
MTFAAPSGLNPGEQFRYVFVTSTTGAATSRNISTYNTRVDDAADNSMGLSTFLTDTIGITNPGDLDWRVIASVEGTDAITNTSTDPSSVGVPIYRLDGDRVANNYVDLWDGGGIARPINIAEDSAERNVDVWTGTRIDGTSIGLIELGSSGAFSSFGVSGDIGFGWVFTSVRGSTQSQSLYGISPIITLPSAPAAEVPTPALLPGLIGMGVAAIRKRRLAQAEDA